MAKTTKKVKKATSEKKAVQEEVKRITATKEPKKLGTKETKKLTTKEPLKQVATKKVEKIAAKPEPKKVTTKEVKKIATKEEPKKAVKKVSATKKVDKQPKVNAKKAYYDTMSLDDCIMNMQKMNVQYNYEDYAQLLCDESDHKQLVTNIIEGNHLHDLELDYKVDGYDVDLVKVTLDKVKDTIDSTSTDYKNIKKEIEKSTSFIMSMDDEKNAEEYLKEFHLCERIMMLARRKHLNQVEEIDTLLNANISEYTKHFMDLAYAILPTWKYEDVVFYEDFMYAYVSSFSELYLMYEQRIQMDCADLYILHGDRDRGNAGYDYLLRDNQIKDYIYYRFAHVYENIDINIAKDIAQSSLQWVDDRYVYYSNIMEIIQK